MASSDQIELIELDQTTGQTQEPEKRSDPEIEDLRKEIASLRSELAEAKKRLPVETDLPQQVLRHRNRQKVFDKIFRKWRCE